jgi:hypothetical protein
MRVLWRSILSRIYSLYAYLPHKLHDGLIDFTGIVLFYAFLIILYYLAQFGTVILPIVIVILIIGTVLYFESKIYLDFTAEERRRRANLEKNMFIDEEKHYEIKTKRMLDEQDKILKIGNLDTVRAVTDVRDIANAFYLVAINKSISNGKVYNVCGGEPLKMREYTNMLIEFSGLQDIEMKIDEKLWRPIDIQYQDGDASLIKNELGWEPTIEIRETIRDLLFFWYNKLK